MKAGSPAATGEYQLLTSPGPAAIAIVRVCGLAAAAFVERHFHTRPASTTDTWRAGQLMRATLVDTDGAARDDILVSVHATPPRWDLRLHLHGNPSLVRLCTRWLRTCGLVEHSEEHTTLWPTADLLEAEACTLLPQMLTQRAAAWLLQNLPRLRETVALLLATDSQLAAQQTCREMAGRFEIVQWFTRPLRVVLAGPPNAGKSTLANALADQAVSVVSPTPGTTRDWVQIPGETHGFPVIWLDTAGLRHSANALEAAAVARTHRLIEEADAVVVVLDATPEAAEPRAAFLRAYANLWPVCVALNKSDRTASAAAVVETLPNAWRDRAVAISALRRTGLASLRDTWRANICRAEAALAAPAAFTARQVQLLQTAAGAPDADQLRAALSRLLPLPNPPLER